MSKRPRVLLVTPPYHSGVVESAGVWMPLSLAYVAGAARAAGAEVEIYDAMSLGHTHEDIARRIEEVRPDIVGLGAITAMEPDAREVCRSAKRIDPGILTVLGNVHPTFCWREILEQDSNVDVVVRGEGEATIADLVAAVASGARPDSLPEIRGTARRKNGVPESTPPRPFVPDIDALEPAWDLIDWPRYFYRPRPEGRLAIVSSSRGCRQRCSFCSQQKFWEKSWRGRRPERFVEELETLRDRHGVRVAMLSDETPTVDQARWERILDLLIERDTGVELLLETRVDDILRDEALLPKYRAAGVSHIYVGVESTSQATLDLYKKDVKVEASRRAIELINAHGMVSETSFVLGTPDETKESIRKTVELAKWYAPDMAFFLAITPWPYADIYEELKPFVATTDYRRYNLVEPVIKPTGMTLEEMKGELHRATGHFFHDRFQRLGELSPEKRLFMVSVLKLLIEHSYLGKEMHAMPPPAARCSRNSGSNRPSRDGAAPWLPGSEYR
jgi:anaerobic magnesium-protoporphyrin IX monomethyl ester cyclase